MDPGRSAFTERGHLVRRYNASVRAALRALRSVQPPKRDRQLLAAVLRDRARALDLAGEAARLAVHDATGAGRARIASSRLLRRTSLRLARYGLTGCAEAPTR